MEPPHVLRVHLASTTPTPIPRRHALHVLKARTKSNRGRPRARAALWESSIPMPVLPRKTTAQHVQQEGSTPMPVKTTAQRVPLADQETTSLARQPRSQLAAPVQMGISRRRRPTTSTLARANCARTLRGVSRESALRGAKDPGATCAWRATTLWETPARNAPKAVFLGASF